MGLKAVIMVMIASFYSGGHAPGEGGNYLATGERYDNRQLLAAHKTLPFGTLLNVCRYRRCISVVVKDRGPYIKGRDLDLSLGAAKALGMVVAGVSRVKVSVPIPQPKPEFTSQLAMIK